LRDSGLMCHHASCSSGLIKGLCKQLLANHRQHHIRYAMSSRKVCVPGTPVRVTSTHHRECNWFLLPAYRFPGLHEACDMIQHPNASFCWSCLVLMWHLFVRKFMSSPLILSVSQQKWGLCYSVIHVVRPLGARMKDTHKLHIYYSSGAGRSLRRTLRDPSPRKVATRPHN
jgi:hypothetical protein